MKKYLVVLVLSFGLISFTEGCKTSQVTAAAKTESITISTIDAGMKAWRDYVVAGKATQMQVDTVKTAYTTYYGSQMVAKAVLEKALTSTGTVTNSTDITAANQAVAQAAVALVNIINQYTSK